MWWVADHDGSRGRDGESSGAEGSKSVARSVCPLRGAEAEAWLRALPSLDTAAAPCFMEVEGRVGTLDDDELVALIQEIGLSQEPDDGRGLTGWLRCALYAEWGRRDPEAAMASLPPVDKASYRRVTPHGYYAVKQAWFSLLRGWAEVNPLLVRDRLKALVLGSPPNEHFLSHRFFALVEREIFRSLAERDPDEAWNEALVIYRKEKRLGPVAGVLRARLSTHQAEAIADSWKKQVLGSEPVRKSLREWATWENAMHKYPPPEWELTLLVAGALAEHGRVEAIEWMRAATPNGASRRSASQLVAGAWAARHPDEAGSLLKADSGTEYAGHLAAGVLLGSPRRGAELVATLGNPADRKILFTDLEARESNTSLFEWVARSFGPEQHGEPYPNPGSLLGDVRFPAPGARNRLPGSRAHFEVLSDVLKTSGLPEERMEFFRALLEKQFSHVVSGG